MRAAVVILSFLMLFGTGDWAFAGSSQVETSPGAEAAVPAPGEETDPLAEEGTAPVADEEMAPAEEQDADSEEKAEENAQEEAQTDEEAPLSEPAEGEKTFSLDNYIDAFSLTVNGKSYTLEDAPVNLGKIDRNGDLSFSLNFNMEAVLGNELANPGDTFTCTVPAVIGNGGQSWSGPLNDPTTKWGRTHGSVGTWTIADGKLTLRFDDEYIGEVQGSIKSAAVSVNGNFDSFKIKTDGGPYVLYFGNLPVLCEFDAIPVVRELSVDKQLNKDYRGAIIFTGTDRDIMTYTIRVAAGDDNTDPIENVKLTDLFTTDNVVKDSITLVKVTKGDKKVDITGQVTEISGLNPKDIYGHSGYETKGWNLGTLERSEYVDITLTAKIDKSKVDEQVQAEKDTTPSSAAANRRKVNNTAYAVGDEMVDEDGHPLPAYDSDTGTFMNQIYVSKSAYKYDPATKTQYYKLTVRADQYNKYVMRDVPIYDYFSQDASFITAVDVVEMEGQSSITKGNGLSNFKNKEVDDSYPAHRWSATVDELAPGQSKTIIAAATISDTAWTQGGYYNSGGTRGIAPRNYVYFGADSDGHYARDINYAYDNTTVYHQKSWLSKNYSTISADGHITWTVRINAPQAQNLDANKISGQVTDTLGSDALVFDGPVTATYRRITDGRTGSPITVPAELASMETDPASRSFTYTIPKEYEDCEVTLTYRTKIKDYETYFGPQRNYHNLAGINGYYVSTYTYTPRIIGLDKYASDKTDKDTAEWTSDLKTTVKAEDYYTDTVSGIDRHYYTQDQLDALVVKYYDKESDAYVTADRSLYKVTPQEITPASGDMPERIKGFRIDFLGEIKGSSARPVKVIYRSTLIPCKLDEYKQYYNSGTLNVKMPDGTYNTDTSSDYFYRSGYKEINKHTYQVRGDKVYWHVLINRGGFAGTPNGKGSGACEKRDAVIYEKIPEGQVFLRAEISPKRSAPSNYYNGNSSYGEGRYGYGYYANYDSPGLSVDYDSGYVGATGTVPINVRNINHYESSSRLGDYNSRNSRVWVDLLIVTQIVDKEALQDTTGRKFTWLNEAGLTPEKDGDNDIYWSGSTASLSHKALTKEMLYNKNIAPNASFTIDLNPDDMDLVPGGDTVKVYDTSSATLQISADSIRVLDVRTGKALVKGTDYTVDMSRMAKDNTFVLTVPDNKHLEIRYTAEVLGAVGETVNVSNKAYFEGYMDSEGSVIDQDVVVMKGSGQSISDIMIWLDKRDEKGDHLKDVTFNLYEYKDGAWKQKDELKIEEADDIKVPSLEQAVLYKLVEAKAPEGYHKDPTPHYFVLRESADVAFEKPEDVADSEIRSMLVASTMTVFNERNHEVPLLKVDEKGKPLAGARLEIRDADGDLVLDPEDQPYQWTSTEEPFTAELASGDYKLAETEAPAGYILADPVSFTVSSDGTVTVDGEETAQIEMKDVPTEISFTKVDDRADAPLSGVLLQILQDGEVIDEWTTNGKPHLVTHLETAVTYQLHEVSAPGGYDPGEDVSFLIDVYGQIRTALEKTEAGDYQLRNTYHAEGSYTFAGEKTLQGHALEDGQFTFEVYEVTDDQQSLLQTVDNEEGGKIPFEPLQYTLPDVGTHTYVVREKAADAPGYTYSDKEYTVVLEVTDNGDGTLHIAPTEESDDPQKLAFENEYHAEGEITLQGSKELTGRTLEAEQFRFELLDENGEVLQTVTNDEEGGFAFAPLKYDQDELGTHTYKVREENTEAGGYVFDDTVYDVVIEVADNGDGTLDVHPAENSADPEALHFSNSYTAAVPVQLEAKKTLDGKAPAAGQFKFRLTPVEGASMPGGKTELIAENDGNGRILFEEIPLEGVEGSTFRYRIEEVVPRGAAKKGDTFETADMIYDAHVLNVTVILHDNGDGTAQPEIIYDGQQTFANRTVAKDGKPGTGDPFTTAPLIIAAATSGIAALLLAACRRKRQ